MLNQLQERRNKLMVDAAAILRTENPTAEQRAQADTMLSEVTELETRIAQLKRVEAHEAEQRAFVPASRGAVTTEAEQRTRAVSALRSYMLSGRGDSEYRDVLTTSASGGAVIPQLMIPELFTALRAFAPILDIVDVRSTDNNGAPQKMSLVNYTQTVLPVVPEGTAIPEIDPAFSSKLVAVDKLSGMVKLSAEEISDSSFDLFSFLRDQWANVMGVSLEHYVTYGDSGNISSLLSGATVGATSAAVGKVAYPDVAALFGSVPQAYARNGKWQMSTQTRAYLIGLVSTTGQPIFNQNVQGDPFASIFGRPVVINDSLAPIATGNQPILFGDYKAGYLLRTDGAPQIKRLDERFADTDEIGFLIRTRVGGVTKWNGVTPTVTPYSALAIQ